MQYLKFQNQPMFFLSPLHQIYPHVPRFDTTQVKWHLGNNSFHFVKVCVPPVDTVYVHVVCYDASQSPASASFSFDALRVALGTARQCSRYSSNEQIYAYLKRNVFFYFVYLKKKSQKDKNDYFFVMMPSMGYVQKINFGSNSEFYQSA